MEPVKDVQLGLKMTCIMMNFLVGNPKEYRWSTDEVPIYPLDSRWSLVVRRWSLVFGLGIKTGNDVPTEGVVFLAVEFVLGFLPLFRELLFLLLGHVFDRECEGGEALTRFDFGIGEWRGAAVIILVADVEARFGL